MCLYICINICIFVYIQKDWALKGLVSEAMSLKHKIFQQWIWDF